MNCCKDWRIVVLAANIVGTTFFSAVTYMYDHNITLLCPNLSGMRKMLMVANDYSDEFKIVFNAGKTQLIPFGNASWYSRLTIGETVICCKLIHLGRCLDTFDAENGIRKVVNDMSRKTKCMFAKFNKADPFVRYKLFKCYCFSLIWMPIMVSDSLRGWTCMCSMAHFNACEK